MQFTHATLRSTHQQFSLSLETRGLSLPFQKELNLWAQIVTGKNFSQATWASNALGNIAASAISAKSIQSALKKRSREVSEDAAIDIFCEAIRHDVHEVSYCMAELVDFVTDIASGCLVHAGEDLPRIGLMESSKPGYISLAKMTMFATRPLETAWIEDNTSFFIHLVNRLANRDGKECMTIFAANHRLASQKSDRIFIEAVKPRIEMCAQAVAQRINHYFDPAEVQFWEAVDYDIVRDVVYDSFDAAIGNDHKSWLSIDCDAAEAMIDHVAARIREGMKWPSREANDGSLKDKPLGWVAHTTHISIAKMLNVAVP